MSIPGLEKMADDEACLHIDVDVSSFSGNAETVMRSTLKELAEKRIAAPIVYGDNFVPYTTTEGRKLMILTARGKKLAA